MQEYVAGSTSIVELIFLQDSASVTGAGKTGLVFNTAGLTCYYKRSNGTASVQVPLVDITTLGTFVSGGFKAADGTNMDGCYEFHPPNAAFAAGAKEVTFFFKGAAAGVAQRPIKFRILAVDPDNATNLGLAALPAFAVNTNGGLPILSFSGTTLGYTITTATNLTTAPPDSAGVGTLLSRLSAARAIYLDNLNVGGPVASNADIVAINQSASRRITITTVMQYERPETGASTYTIEVRTYDRSGAAINADTTPTLIATGIISGSLAANLSAASNPATGLYRWTYTVSNNAAVEQVRFDVSATLIALVFTLSAYTQVTDLVAATWTSTDAGHLTALFNKLPTAPYFTGSGLPDGSVLLPNASITSAKFLVGAVAGVESGYLEQQAQIWRLFFKPSEKTTTHLFTYANDGSTILTTQTVSDDGAGHQTRGAAS